LKCAQDAFSSVEDRQWLTWGVLLLLNLKKVADEEDAECECKACLEEIWAMEEASRKAEEDRRIMGEEAMTILLENSGGMSAEEFSSKICGIEQEFGLVSVGEGGDDAMEVSEGEITGDRSQVLVNQGHPKPRPLTKPMPIAIDSVDMDEDGDNESEDSDVAEVWTIPSKARSKLSGRSKRKRSLGEVEVTREGVPVRKVHRKMFWRVALY